MILSLFSGEKRQNFIKKKDLTFIFKVCGLVTIG